VSRFGPRDIAVVVGVTAIVAAGCGSSSSESKSSAATSSTPSPAMRTLVAASWHTNPPPTWTSSAFCTRLSAGLRGLGTVLDQASDVQILNIQPVRYELERTTPPSSAKAVYSKSLADLDNYIHDLTSSKPTVQKANTAYDDLRAAGSTAGCH
jgi:hypothetical protein